ncbi:MAG: DUF1801 domain-containing protein [Bacteroidota bacterium]|nr:DUF1801 domain-containing protein [Bacteroidota bacterium]
MNPKVDFYFKKVSSSTGKAPKWQNELEHLRTILLGCGLNEELKWGVPCYTFENSNIVLIHAFKEYCALLFFKGALLKDEKRILIQQTKNVQSARQIRFSSLSEITKLKTAIKSYVREAIEVEKSGLKVELKKSSDYSIPDEFQEQLKNNSTLKNAFYALTSGRQRAYLLYFSAAKQSTTREARVKKCTKAILNGKGLND